MENNLLKLISECLKPSSTHESQPQAPPGVSPGVSAIAHDLLHFDITSQDNLDAKNLKGKSCPHYYDLATIFGNDIAMRDRAITGNDFIQINEDIINNPVGVGLGDEDELEEGHPTHSSMVNTPNESFLRGWVNRKLGK